MEVSREWVLAGQERIKELEAEVKRLRAAAVAVMPTLSRVDDGIRMPYCAECGETKHDDDCPVGKLQRIAGIELTRRGWQLKGGA